jgi:hypothetical protein
MGYGLEAWSNVLWFDIIIIIIIIISSSSSSSGGGGSSSSGSISAEIAESVFRLSNKES